MSTPSTLRATLALALALCAALASAPVRADKKHDPDPLADTDSDTDVTGDDDAPAKPDPEPAAEDDKAPDASASTDEAEAGTDADASPAPDSLVVEPFLGAGMGTRGFSRPTPLGVQRLGTTAFPALDTGLRVTAWPSAAFSLGVLLHYQTSLGMSVREEPPFALANKVSVRSERIELSVAPTFRLGDDPNGVAFAFPIGFALRTFWPEVHKLMTPGYSLGGPLLRAELIVPWSDVLSLRVGPELQWIILIDHSIQNDGVAAQAVGIGGEATLALRIGTVLALRLAYREAHILAANVATGGESFSDVERFLTLGLAGRL